jgi:hypothetical protein
LSERIAGCLVWANWDHPCKTDRGWPIIGYANVNIDPASHAVEPALRCIHKDSGPHLAGVVHQVHVRPYVPPDWNKPVYDIATPENWSERLSTRDIEEGAREFWPTESGPR